MRKPSTRLIAGILSAAVIVQIPFLVSAETNYQKAKLEHAKTQQEVVKLHRQVDQLRGNLTMTTSKLTNEGTKSKSLEAQLGKANNELTIEKQTVQSVKKQLAQLKENRANQRVSVQSSSTGQVVDNLTALATAYNANGGGINGPGHVTATGTPCTPGVTVSVDPNVIPLGSVVEITCPDYPSINGRYIAQDTGGAIKGHRVDIAMASENDCFKFGKHTIHIAVVKEG